MVIIRLRRLIISVILITAVTVVLLGIGLSLNEGEPWSLKFDYQNFFFWGLVAVIIQILTGLSLVFNHRKILNIVKRISTIDDIDSVYAEKLFDDIGPLGSEIKNLLRHNSQLSGLRTARISALNSLTEILCEGYAESILVTDVRGEILSMSDKLRGNLQKDKNESVIKNVLDIRNDIKLSEVLVFIEKHRSAWTDPDGSGLSCTPVFDKNNAVQFCLWEFETSIFTGKLKEHAAQRPDLRRSYGRLKNLLKTRLPEKKGTE